MSAVAIDILIPKSANASTLIFLLHIEPAQVFFCYGPAKDKWLRNSQEKN
ncbi:hypothetical protein [Candidatus Bathycorpusculum sp.]|nr:hypothetical protein [Candidatus Termitimicrobium sp.]